jgi:hypothetical protein
MRLIRPPAADGTLGTAQHVGVDVPRYPESDSVPQLFAVRDGIAATSSEFHRFAAAAAMILWSQISPVL